MKTSYEARISTLEQEKTELESQVRSWKQKVVALTKDLEASNKEINTLKLGSKAVTHAPVSSNLSQSSDYLKSMGVVSDENDSAAQSFSQRMQRDKRFKNSSQIITSENINNNLSGKIIGKEGGNIAPAERSPTRNPLQVVKDDGNSPLRSQLQSPFSTSVNQSLTKNKYTALAAAEEHEIEPFVSDKSTTGAVAKSNIPGSSIISRLRSRFARA